MTLLDWIILAVLIISTLAGFASGLFRSLFSFAGLILGFLLAAWNYKVVAERLSHLISNMGIAEVVAFLLIAIVVMLIAGVIGTVLRKTAKVIGLGWLDSLFGGLFGFFRGCLLVTAGMMAVAAFLPPSHWVTDSKLAPYCLDAAHQMAAVVPADLRDRIAHGATEIEHGANKLLRR